MKNDLIHQMTDSFQGHYQLVEGGFGCWLHQRPSMLLETILLASKKWSSRVKGVEK